MSKAKLSVFVGNGINRLEGVKGFSWSDLLGKLKEINNANDVNLDNAFKPFPLSFQEIVFRMSGSFDEGLRTIKNNIAQVFYVLEPNQFHKRLVNSPNVENIITTNYDYALEKVLVENFDNRNERLPNSTSETKHSIRRRCYFDLGEGKSKSIWHIHGEINHNQNFKPDEYPSQSIQIGYDHYGEYINQIQDYLNGIKYKNQPKIEIKLKENIEGNSWIDLLFKDRVIILGLGLDFSEIDLWWLLNYRQQLFKRKFKGNATNTIVYYQFFLKDEYYNSPHDVDSIIKSRIDKDKKLAKKEVLIALGVDVQEIMGDTYEDCYEQVYKLEKII